MKKTIVLLIIICLFVSGCGEVNESQEQQKESEDILSEEVQKNQTVYDEALALAYEGNFFSAVKKINELSEPYLDSEELIELFEKDIDSSFIGTWFCSRENSCNDMDITLEIYPVYRSGEIELYFERDMICLTGLGSSNITGTIDIPSSNSITVSSFGNAQWTVSENTLKEVFTSDGNKTNTYFK
ncbi:MAG: hypothetical protein HFI69_12415 [Lachnospiraceae bacterium]|jgi:hypothetical protein|nr:hypothetical protein [Lachnospiraceae bacterium]